MLDEARPRSEGAKVTTPKSRLPCSTFDADLARRDPADVDLDVRVLAPEPADERQQRMHGGLVRADDHAAAAKILQLADGKLRFLGEARQPLGVVTQHAARLP